MVSEKNILNKYNAKLFKIGAGKKEENKVLNISGPISSLYKRKNFEFKNQYEIKVKKLDDILYDEKLDKNVLLKIDCEGAELDILEGSLKTLSISDYLIIEVRLQKIETYNPSDLINDISNSLFPKFILPILKKSGSELAFLIFSIEDSSAIFVIIFSS